MRAGTADFIRAATAAACGAAADVPKKLGSPFPSESSLPAMRDADRRTHEGWRDGIRRGQEDGSIRADIDPAGAASALLALSRGFAALLPADPAVLDSTDVGATCDMWITTVLANDKTT